jgi:hypothetical protein
LRRFTVILTTRQSRILSAGFRTGAVCYRSVRWMIDEDAPPMPLARRIFLPALLLILLTACGSAPATTGPRLLSQATVGTPATATLRPSATPSDIPPAESATPSDILPTETATTSERVSPLQLVTVAADVVIVTPTLPPSKTPSATPSLTTTPTTSPTPTQTVTATATTQQFPTAVATPFPAIVIQPVDALCPTAWAFIQPPPPGCPLAPSTVGNGVYQSFERGYMLWDGRINAIYVLFSDGNAPYWTRYADSFDEAIHPWEDPQIDFDLDRSPNTWQPWRGFGKLWREQPRELIRNRVGWGTIQREESYSIRTQMREDGSLFLTDPSGRVFLLIPGGQWQLYAGYAF